MKIVFDFENKQGIDRVNWTRSILWNGTNEFFGSVVTGKMGQRNDFCCHSVVSILIAIRLITNS